MTCPPSASSVALELCTKGAYVYPADGADAVGCSPSTLDAGTFPYVRPLLTFAFFVFLKAALNALREAAFSC